MNCLLDSLVFIVFYNDVQGYILSVNKQALTYIILSEYGCPDVFFQFPPGFLPWSCFDPYLGPERSHLPAYLCPLSSLSPKVLLLVSVVETFEPC